MMANDFETLISLKLGKEIEAAARDIQERQQAALAQASAKGTLNSGASIKMMLRIGTTSSLASHRPILLLLRRSTLIYVAVRAKR